MMWRFITRVYKLLTTNAYGKLKLKLVNWNIICIVIVLQTTQSPYLPLENVSYIESLEKDGISLRAQEVGGIEKNQVLLCLSQSLKQVRTRCCQKKS